VGAQKVEILGRYQFTHLDPAYNAGGWNLAVQGNFKHVLGIAAGTQGPSTSLVKRERQRRLG
jgi:hypothetical protein